MNKDKKNIIIGLLFLILVILVILIFKLQKYDTKLNTPNKSIDIEQKNVGFGYYTKGDAAYLYKPSHDGLNARECKIENVDPETFTVINPIYTKDKNRVFASCKEIVGADPETFELASNGFARDKNHAYLYENKIDEADGKTFEVLDNGFLKDKNNYYFGIKKINVDYQTFQIGYCHSKDKNYVYSSFDSRLNSNPIIKEANPKSFEEFDNSCYASDNNNVFFMENIVDGADVDSFTITNSNSKYDAQDKNFKYKSGKKI